MFTTLLQFAIAFLVLLYIVAVETIALATSILSIGDWLCVAVVLVGVRLLVREVRKHLPRGNDSKRVRVRSVSAVPKNAVIVAPLAARSKKIHLRRSCHPVYWLTFFGQEEMRTIISKGAAPFESVLATIVEETEEESVVDEQVVTHDDSSFASSTDEIINIDIEELAIENTSNLLTAAPEQKRRRRVVLPPSPLRRSARLASQKTTTALIVLGSIVSADGRRRSARLSQSCR